MDSVADIEALTEAPAAALGAHRWAVGHVEIEPIAGGGLTALPESAVVRTVRRTIEVAIALAGLVCLAVAIPLLTLLIRVDSPGPAIFRQRRMGRNGRPFTIYKLRTMVRDAEEMRDKVLNLNVMNGLTFKAPEDPRRTRVGRLLRRLSLDEAPQFWNVLIGDMALVGPRPPLPCEYMHFDDEEHQRLLVKPGITGLWQVSGRNTLEHSHMVELDRDYVRRRTLRLDLSIILRTIPAMLRGRGAY